MNKQELKEAIVSGLEAEIRAIESLKNIVHKNACEKGFWDDPSNDGEKIALIHSELSEALEASRDATMCFGNGVARMQYQPSEKIPEFNAMEEELADAIIRILDFAAGRGLRMGEAIAAKIAYNAGRPRKHGRNF